jgi:DNA-binding NarL/FixJ family response regulator
MDTLPNIPSKGSHGLPSSPTLVFVVDDHAFFRAGVIAWLQGQQGITCCGEAGTLAEARAALRGVAPDILLLDLGFKEGDGLEFIREARTLRPGMRVIVISQRDETVFAERAIKAGASGYLMKSEAVDRLLDAIHAVMAGDIHLSRAAAARVSSAEVAPGLRRSQDVAELSDRELQVFALIGSGLGPKEVATRLGISPKTVETYREHLKKKFGVQSAAMLTVIATEWVNNDGRIPSRTPLKSA